MTEAVATRRPCPSSPYARDRMRSQRTASTSPEVALRRVLFTRGLRYRVDFPLPLLGVRRRADVAFTRAKVAVFVDGCFWHACPEHGTTPKANAWYWVPKLARNVLRDNDTDRRLAEAGWAVVRVWEHEDPEEAAARVEAAVRESRERREKSERERWDRPSRVACNGSSYQVRRNSQPPLPPGCTSNSSSGSSAAGRLHAGPIDSRM